MTPPNKAYNLYHKFYNTLLPNVRERQRIAIEHSLIAVDEIINTDCLIDEDTYVMKPSYIQYWQEVKQELLKL
jgi:hypothetical protein